MSNAKGSCVAGFLCGPVIRAVVHQQWMLLRRDRGLALLGAGLLLASLMAIFGGFLRQQQWMTEKTAAVHADAENWAHQGETNPHYATHFGRYVFKPVSALAAIDPGLLDHLGLMVLLESHKQNLASGQPADNRTPLSRFSSFSAATVLQLLAPLLVILTGFSAFAGVRARTLLDQEISSGIDGRVLLLGRLLATGLVVAAFLVLLAVAGAAALIVQGASAAALLRLALMILGDGFYLFAFLALTIGVSALATSPRAALATLLGFWIVAVVLVPRMAPVLAARMYPTPTATQFESQIKTAFNAELERKDGPLEGRSERSHARIMREHGVSRLEQLPLHVQGIWLEENERLSTELFHENLTRLQQTYRRQEMMQRLFALVSPMMALKPWSAALAESDLAAHNQFVSAAENYRYRLVQLLNRDVGLHRPRTGNQVYVADVARITAGLGAFQPRQESTMATLARQWPDLAILFAWMAAALGFALWCGARLSLREHR